jgi:FkbM family methyltransferase
VSRHADLVTLTKRVARRLLGRGRMEPVPVDPTPDEPLVIVDVGAAGGLSDDWSSLRRPRVSVMFEPNADAARELHRGVPERERRIVVESALAEAPGRRTLYQTASLQCWSLLEPNHALLAGYSIGPAFRVRGTTEVEVTTYADLHAQGRVPVPDVLKVDVQGYEHEVLTGFGPLLGACLGVQLEAHVRPIYSGQRLLGDLVELLAGQGLGLRRLVPTGKFDGDLVEFDAWFTPGLEATQALAPGRAAKLRDIERIWDLSPRRRAFRSDIWGAEW